MKDYQKHLDDLKQYSKHIGQETKYLRKYWLIEKELNENWINIKKKLFCEPMNYPSFVICNSLGTIVTKGGLVFSQKDHELLTHCMKSTGDNYFVIIEDYDEKNPPHTSGPSYRFKYPAKITWEEIMSGGTISIDVYQNPNRNFFIFGDSGLWGRYVGNDYEWPLKILGFDKEYSQLFHETFIISEEDTKDIKQWLNFYIK